MKVFHHDSTLLHNPPYEILFGKAVPYYEAPNRIHKIREVLEEFPDSFFFVSAKDSTVDAHKYIQEVHDTQYLDFLKTAHAKWVEVYGDEQGWSRIQTPVFPETFAHASLLLAKEVANPDEMMIVAQAGLYCFDQSCPITKDTHTAVIASVQTTLAAAQSLVGQKTGGAFALTRPPGHHAASSLCGGYCYLNNIAIAARFLQSNVVTENDGPSKVAILDIDYHHGNGTQAIFYSDPSVLYASIHSGNDYPYFTGKASETGEGKGEGFNMNFPLPRQTDNDKYCETLAEAVACITKYNPSHLLVSLGLDTYVEDPICDFNITTEGYSRIGAIIAQAQVPTLFVLEGGYHMDSIGRNVRTVLQGFRSGITG